MTKNACLRIGFLHSHFNFLHSASLSISAYGLALIAIHFALGGTNAAAQTYGLSSRSPVGSFLNQKMPSASTMASGAWTVVNAFPNLTFQNPTFLTCEPHTNRLYVCGREGKIWFFANDPNTTTKTVFLDLSAQTQGWDDCGLLGFVFHPQYGQAGSPNRGYIYVYYQYQLPGNIQGSSTVRPGESTPSYNRLSRLTVPDGSLVADPNSELVLINQFDRDVWHNGGGICFGADGFLYLSNGDEGALADVFDNAQRINRGLFSGVLRIDVDQNASRSHPIRRQPQDAAAPPAGWPHSSTANYYIPNDNPWLDPNGGNLEEFWAIGVRSPHRLTFDPPTGQFWLGDVGQDIDEEVDLIQKAGNYQWPYKEGNLGGVKAMPSTIIGKDTAPVYSYVHDQGNGCVIGGYVYRGSKWAADLWGKYIFGDDDSGRIWSLTYNGANPPTITYLANMPPGINYAGGLSSFGLDQNNELYMCTMGMSGQVWRLDRAGTTSAVMPALLSQTGAFSDLPSLSPVAGVIPYDVNVPLWSDNAVKRRWISLPNNGAPYDATQQIAFSSTGEWTFPNGTVFVKHFELGTDDTNPSLRKRLETRLLVRDNNGGAYGVTYKWRADNSDADLLAGSLTENIAIATGSGFRTQTWYYPSQQDCLVCHNPNANYVLGVKSRQQNGNFTYPSTGVTDNQLRTWNHLGMFNPALNESAIPGYPHLTSVTNAAAPLVDRVRSYLDANCAQCHRPNGAQAYFDARFDTPLPNQGLISGALANNLGIAGAQVIAMGDVSHSMIHLRLNATGPNQMPPLARNVVDSQSLAVVDAWINSLAPLQPLPPPWQDLDIGNTGFAGTGSLSGATFSIQASGDDIWDYADAFNFVYQSFNGDCQVVARVATLQETDGWAKSGVMIRETLTPDSRHASMFMSASQGASFERRLATGGASTGDTVGAFAVLPPEWVKLVRAGNTFTGYYSDDGINWTLVGSDTVPMAGAVYAGMAVTAHDNTVLTTSTLDNVQINTQTNTSPVITMQPQSQTVNPGASVTFTVQASGSSPLSYQWKFKGANISGATSSGYTLGNVQTNNAGAYSVLVTNVAGNVISANAMLTVNLPPTILVQPQSQAVNPGGNVTFSVQAAGSSPLICQWTFKGASIPGATASSYLLGNAQTNNAGAYAVTITNAAGSVTSSNALLTLNLAPAILAQPQNQTVNPGSNVTFSVQAGGTTPLSYQWLFNGTNIPGATTGNYLLNNAQTNNAGVYSVIVTNVVGKTTSANALLAITFAPTIVVQPQSQTVTAGSNVTFSVQAAGTAPLGYQWLLSGIVISGATSSSYTLNNVQPSKAGNYAVLVTNVAGNAFSANAVLTVNVAPAITVQPQSQTVAAGSNVTFSVQAGGTAPLSYQWRYAGTNIPGATAGSYLLNNAQTNDAGIYAVTISNVVGGVTSANVLLTVNLPPVILTQPLSQSVNAGSNVAFSVQAAGTMPLSYQWFFNGTNLHGATTNTYLLNNVQTASAGVYTVTITNVAGAVTSSNTLLAVSLPPTIVVQPQSRTVMPGGNVTFTVQAAGTAPLTYQWMLNGANIPGATTNSCVLPNVQTNNTGAYAVQVVNSAGSITSSNAVLTVMPPAVNAPLPPPWQQQDVGNVGLPGGGAYAYGVFTVQASGNDIWDYADAFHFIFQPVTGDARIIARVINFQNAANTWAKAGVMVRESLATGSRQVFMTMSTANGASFQYRTNTASASTSTTLNGPVVPYWVKLTRAGDLFTGYDSADGTNWAQIGNVSLPMPQNVFIGLAATPHDNTIVDISTFDNVLVWPPPVVVPSFISTWSSSSGIFSMTLQGPPSQAYEIQGSTNLTNWSALSTLTNTEGRSQYIETNPPDASQRFYRARLLP